MLGNLEEMQKASKMQMDSMSKSAMLMLKSAQKMTTEAADQTRDQVERCTHYFEKIAGVKSLDEAISLQSEFAAANWERFFSGATKMAETCAGLAKDVAAPVREAANIASNVAQRGGQDTTRMRAAS